jgi:hypothetical protein
VDLCGLKGAPKTLHGRSVAPLLSRPDTPWDRPGITQVYRPQGMGYSLRNERYRYTMWADGTLGEELYAYESDPREMRNLAAVESASALKKQLRARLDSILSERGKKASI